MPARVVVMNLFLQGFNELRILDNYENYAIYISKLATVRFTSVLDFVVEQVIL